MLLYKWQASSFIHLSYCNSMWPLKFNEYSWVRHDNGGFPCVCTELSSMNLVLENASLSLGAIHWNWQQVTDQILLSLPLGLKQGGFSVYGVLMACNALWQNQAVWQDIMQHDRQNSCSLTTINYLAGTAWQCNSDHCKEFKNLAKGMWQQNCIAINWTSGDSNPGRVAENRPSSVCNKCAQFDNFLR